MYGSNSRSLRSEVLSPTPKRNISRKKRVNTILAVVVTCLLTSGSIVLALGPSSTPTTYAKQSGPGIKQKASDSARQAPLTDNAPLNNRVVPINWSYFPVSTPNDPVSVAWRDKLRSQAILALSPAQWRYATDASGYYVLRGRPKITVAK